MLYILYSQTRALKNRATLRNAAERRGFCTQNKNPRRARR